MRNTQRTLLIWVEQFDNLLLEMNSPGDGRTRYNFFTKNEKGGHGSCIGNCLGLQEAHTWLSGYRAAKYYG